MSPASATLVVEIQTEELPPKALTRLSSAFAEIVGAELRAAGFLEADSMATAYATPRRLGVAIKAVRSVAPDRPFTEKLLPASLAFDAEGRPTPALLGKLKAKQLSHVDPKSLRRERDGKTEVLAYAGVAKGGPLVNALQTALENAIEKLPIPKAMSYASAGSYYNDVKFIRPAHQLLALHGAEIVRVSALGLESGRMTCGHRFLAKQELEIGTADAYVPTLEAEGKVQPDFAKRRAMIVGELLTAAGGATVLMPDALLEEVTALVEWPKVYTGGFAASFLEVPQECLILTMQHNQRYFALADADGRLQNRFLLVSNIDPRDPEAIIRGNERVLHARLADAKFFFDQDRRQSLESRLRQLDGIVYHHRLGSQGQRVVRLRVLARRIAEELGSDPALAERAAMLAKADLVTEMVGEFPELQGTMGRYYAQHDGEAPAVAEAIAEHYWPRYAGDTLPQGTTAQALALADKLEALAGLFGIGQAPSGDKDPFGLRRAAIGIVRILTEKKLDVSLPKLVALAFDVFSGTPAVQSAHADVESFIYERLRVYLRELGYTANQVASVVDSRPAAIHATPARLEAVKAFEQLPEAEALAAANKRVVNILRKAESEAAAAVDRSLLGDGAEHDLYAKVQALLPVVHAHVECGEYAQALCALASAKTSVDRFFDDVLVMDQDSALRANRLALLRGLAEVMNGVADISKLAV
ncbi:MAG TPA: glycine--tRNA ligase subunit beta [Casimicrobiaceae bacterium]